MKYDIFISYRRKGGYETAKHLYDLFSKDGYRVSFDLDTLRNGDFDQALLKRIDQCSDFILILSKGAFARTLDPAFNPRQDWLRIELAYAEKTEKYHPHPARRVRGFSRKSSGRYQRCSKEKRTSI